MVLVAVETPTRLEFIQNGTITPDGRLAQQIAQSDQIIENNNDPTSLFSIHPDLLKEHYERRDRNLSQLGIDVSEAPERIGEIKRTLAESGFPIHWMGNKPTFAIELVKGHPQQVPLLPAK